ncbi:MAG: T9SS type A sorting domain-containing protein [Bacteroidetes bacterium]|nr:T9SS type A sorting domain-containing protein [Bacteroidota bacterium]
MLSRIVFILLVVGCQNVFSQVSLQWHFYGDTPEESRLIVADSHSNVYTLGHVGGLRKYGHTGDTLFYNTDTINYTPNAIDLDANDEIVTVGTYYGLGSQYEILVQKFDTLGNKIWATGINTPTGNREFATSLTFDQSNNIYVTGWDGDQFFGKFYTAKISSGGQLVWGNSFPKNGFDPYYGLDVAVHDTNNVYACGFVDENGTTNDMLLVKYNSNGDTVWSRKFGYYQTFGGQWTTEDNGTEVETDQAGNVYVMSKDIFGKHDVLIKYNSAGVKQWNKVVHTLPTDIKFMSIQNDIIYIAGNTDLGFGLVTPLAIKMDLNGIALFDSVYTNQGFNFVDAKIYDGGFVMTGNYSGCNGCNWDIITTCYDSLGNTKWTHVMNTVNGYLTDQVYGLAIDKTGGIYLTGNGNGSNYWMSTYKLFPCYNINPVLVKNGSVYTANFIAGADYLWRDCANDSLVAQGIELFQFVEPYLSNFAVEISVGSCSDTTSCTFAGINTMYSATNKFALYPNPASEVISIRGLTSVVNAQLYSTQLILINNYILSRENNSIDISKLPKGVYLLTINDGNYNEVIKLIK